MWEKLRSGLSKSGRITAWVIAGAAAATWQYYDWRKQRHSQSSFTDEEKAQWNNAVLEKQKAKESAEQLQRNASRTANASVEIANASSNTASSLNTTTHGTANRDKSATAEPIDDCQACPMNVDESKPFAATTTPVQSGNSAATTPTPPVFAYRHSGCPLTRAELGRAAWGHLHTLAAYYPEKPSREEQEEMEQFMWLYAKYYPCNYCAERTLAEMRRNPPQVSSRDSFARWMCAIHNEVNLRMGKPEFNCDNVKVRWREGPSDGSCVRRPALS